MRTYTKEEILEVIEKLEWQYGDLGNNDGVNLLPKGDIIQAIQELDE